MSKQLNKDAVAALAQLARLKFTDEELEKHSKDLNAILGYVEQLESVDSEGLEPTLQVTGLKNVMRTDEVREQLATPDELLAITPKTKDKYIQVGRMV